MKTRYFLIVLLGLISFSCLCKKQTTDTNTSTETTETNTEADTSTETDTSAIEIGSSQIDDWSDQPTSSSSKIKVLNAALTFGSLPNGLQQMGYSITENTGTSLTTNARRAINDDVRLIAWVDGNDIILTSETQEFTQSEFGEPEPNGFTTCAKGSTSSMPDCWRLILVVANRLGGEKQYQ